MFGSAFSGALRAASQATAATLVPPPQAQRVLCHCATDPRGGKSHHAPLDAELVVKTGDGGSLVTGWPQSSQLLTCWRSIVKHTRCERSRLHVQSLEKPRTIVALTNNTTHRVGDHLLSVSTPSAVQSNHIRISTHTEAHCNICSDKCTTPNLWRRLLIKPLRPPRIWIRRTRSGPKCAKTLEVIATLEEASVQIIIYRMARMTVVPVVSALQTRSARRE